jgi:hypothetical protein
LYSVVTNDGGINAGTYDVVLALTDRYNYAWNTEEPTSKNITVEYDIKQADNSWTTTPSISGWTYGEAAGTPSGIAKFGNVKVEYKASSDDDEKYSATAPTDAGNYIARFTVDGTDNYTGLAKKIAFVIEKAEPNLTTNASIDKTYGDEAVKLTTKYTGNGTLTYDSSNKNVVTVDNDGNVTIVGAGETTITATLSETANYKSATADIAVKVEKSNGNLSVTAIKYEKTYGDDSFNLGCKLKEDATLKYTSDNTNVATVDSDGNVTITGAGEANITISSIASANYSADELEVTINVAKADINNASIQLTLPEDGYSYNGSEKKPEVSSVTTSTGLSLTATTDYTVEYKYNVDAGTAKVIIKAVENGNYEGSAETEFTIEKAKVSIPVIETLTYTGNEQKATVPESTLYSVVTNDGGINAGTYDVVLALTDRYNYAWNTEEPTSKNVTVGYDIKQADNSWTTTPSISGWTYGEAAGTPTGIAKFGNVKVEYKASSDDDEKYSATAPTEAGNYIARFTVDGTDNYTGLTKNIVINVAKAATAPNTPETTLTPEHTVCTVVDIELPTNWQWSENDKNTALEDNVSVIVTAKYVGEDAGNYENESVEITITRKPCEHKGGTATCTKKAVCILCNKEYGELDLSNHSKTTEVINYKEATCTEAGYTGDTVCADCGEVLEKGTEISVKEPEPPYIEGNSNKKGWDVIRDKASEAIEQAIANPGETKVITVIMNGTDTVPGDIFTQIKGQDVTIVFDMGDGIKWTVDGKSVVSDNIQDINFKVYTDTSANTIPDDIIAEVINNVTGEKYTMNLTLAYDGEFGFTAVLSIGLDKKNAGYYANLFYYNKTSNKLDFICADKIAEDGTANLTFTHASDYTIVIDAVSLDPDQSSTEITTPEDEATTEDNTTVETEEKIATEKDTTTATEENITTTVEQAKETSTTNETSTDKKVPKTGDMTLEVMLVWFVVLSGMCIIISIVARKKKI